MFKLLMPSVVSPSPMSYRHYGLREFSFFLFLFAFISLNMGKSNMISFVCPVKPIITIAMVNVLLRMQNGPHFPFANKSAFVDQMSIIKCYPKTRACGLEQASLLHLLRIDSEGLIGSVTKCEFVFSSLCRSANRSRLFF